MKGRRLYVDRSPGETRGVVTLDGRPERLLIDRPDDVAVQRYGARAVARVARIDRSLASAFLDLGEGPQAMTPLAPGLVEGGAVEVEIAGEARAGKGAVARLLGPAEGPPRLLAAAPGLAARLAALAVGAVVVEGPEAREAADAAQDAALSPEHPLPGGGSIAVEPTRALTAIDVDLGARTGDPRRIARAANLAAIVEAARVLRLKGLGGLVVIDLVGRGHDGAALSAAAKAAFAPDEPGVSIGPISRFGAFELVIPRRWRPLAEVLCDSDGRLSAESRGLAVLRALERAALADPGGRIVARAPADVVLAAGRHINVLTARVGARVELRPDPALAADRFEIETP
ncbi:MAG: ribonuclease E/G [Caulobacteraceae bacterium]|nr:ribonuclease E/G [Caulobacteraceae bacterium]